MKARIKGTNVIVECIDTGTLINENKGIECRHSNGAIEVIPGDCLIELESTFDWQSFRNQAAKDILCAIRNRESSFTRNGQVAVFHKDFIEMAVEDADALIAKLKEKEDK